MRRQERLLPSLRVEPLPFGTRKTTLSTVIPEGAKGNHNTSWLQRFGRKGRERTKEAARLSIEQFMTNPILISRLLTDTSNVPVTNTTIFSFFLTRRDSKLVSQLHGHFKDFILMFCFAVT